MKNVFYLILAVVIYNAFFGADTPPNQTTDKTASTVVPVNIPAVPKAVFITELYVTGNIVNLRAGPSTKYRVLAKLARGKKVKADGTREGKWVKIISAKPDVEGWMHGDFLDAKRATSVVSSITKSNTPKKRQIAAPTTTEKTAARKEIIRWSISSYPGSCPCPYNRDRAGRKCGRRSAWSRPGGYSPICYASDVTEARLRTYFKRKKGITY